MYQNKYMENINPMFAQIRELEIKQTYRQEVLTYITECLPPIMGLGYTE